MTSQPDRDVVRKILLRWRCEDDYGLDDAMRDLSSVFHPAQSSNERKDFAQSSAWQVERGIQLAEECAHKYANEANWHALRAHLERMTQTLPGGGWSDAEIAPPDKGSVSAISTTAESLKADRV